MIRNTISCFLPIIFHRVVRVAVFVAGPVIRKTKAAPGDMPAFINANAMGTDAEEQTYNGMPIMSIKNIVIGDCPA